MPPTRVWNLTRQNMNTLDNSIPIWQTIRNEMAQDMAYAGNVENIDNALRILQDVLQQTKDHLTAEGK